MTPSPTPGPTPSILSKDDGTLWALDPFPSVLEIADALFDPDRRQWYGIERRDDIVDVNLANGRWIYRIVEERPDRGTVIGEIVYREDPPLPKVVGTLWGRPVVEVDYL